MTEVAVRREYFAGFMGDGYLGSKTAIMRNGPGVGFFKGEWGEPAVEQVVVWKQLWLVVLLRQEASTNTAVGLHVHPEGTFQFQDPS